MAKLEDLFGHLDLFFFSFFMIYFIFKREVLNIWNCYFSDCLLCYIIKCLFFSGELWNRSLRWYLQWLYGIHIINLILGIKNNGEHGPLPGGENWNRCQPPLVKLSHTNISRTTIPCRIIAEVAPLLGTLWCVLHVVVWKSTCILKTLWFEFGGAEQYS